jgi:hypothetical protein
MRASASGNRVLDHGRDGDVITVEVPASADDIDELLANFRVETAGAGCGVNGEHDAVGGLSLVTDLARQAG